MRIFKLGERGQVEVAVTAQLTLIISLLIAVVIVHQMFIAGTGPTPYPYLENGEPSMDATWDHDDNENTAEVPTDPNPDYDADALQTWNNTRNLAWAGIGLMAIAIIILAASVILSVVRGFGGRGV